MEQFSIGFWGSFFGTVALMLVAATFAYMRSLRRVAVNAFLSALTSAFFVLAFLGALPIHNANTLTRVLAHIQCVAATILAYQLVVMMGLLRQQTHRLRLGVVLLFLAGLTIGIGWLLTPLQSLVISTVLASLLGILAIAISLRSMFKGDRLAWGAVAGVACMLMGLLGLNWIALDRENAPWQVHALSAIAGMTYLGIMATVLWARYAYLIELHEVRVHGPSYDPVTRMRSDMATGHLVNEIFRRYRDKPAPLGVIVVSIANMLALEKLYGNGAVNHALFVCAGRLRRTAPNDVEMGRLMNNSFLLLVRNGKDAGRLIRLARALQARLCRSILLNIEEINKAQIRWQADIGVGVLKVVDTDAVGTDVVSKTLSISRTAWAYPSRVAWFDDKSGDIVGMPVL